MGAEFRAYRSKVEPKVSGSATGSYVVREYSKDDWDAPPVEKTIACPVAPVPSEEKTKLVQELRDKIEEARYEDGHGGYSGSLAEKQADLRFLTEIVESSHIEQFLDDRCDKWGPCLAVRSQTKDGVRWVVGALCSS